MIANNCPLQVSEEIVTASYGVENRHRLAYIDNLKVLLIIFVIIHHVAITYSGIGTWFYIEHKSLDNASFYFFLLFGSFNQAYSISLFFMLAAYFIPASLSKKGTKRFIKDRLFRLGIPTAIFTFLINPVIIKMAHPDINLFKFYQDGITSFGFISWMEHMWFALTLLIFSIIYIPTNRWFARLVHKYSFAINTKNVTMLASLIAIIAFIVRFLVYPIGTSAISLILCFFVAYIFMFLLGIIAHRKNIFESISHKIAKKWFAAAFVIGLPLWILIMHFGINRNNLQDSAAIGGWNLPAFGYAFWESFFCIAIIIGLVGIFKNKFNTKNSLQRFLSANAFAVYVFHPLPVVTASILLKNVDILPIFKFIVIVGITVPISFILASLVRRVGILQKMFS
jgi:glucans biosynthesis protein C